MWQWKAQSGGRIFEQLKVLGTSLDWSRAKFTMDPDMSRAVREAFVRLYEEGLIYRANSLVNWSIKAQTVISDLEVVREEPAPGVFNSELFSFAYPLAEGEGEIVVATTRPETMGGDTAIAVHPDDARYQHLIGRHVRHPFVDRTIPIIADALLADPSKGTGAVKVTPAHDFNDYECGKRNNLPMLNILNLDGTLNREPGWILRMSIASPRARPSRPPSRRRASTAGRSPTPSPSRGASAPTTSSSRCCRRSGT